MITPDEIKAKGLRIWQSDAFWGSVGQSSGEPVVEIPFGKLKARDLLDDFTSSSEAVAKLRRESKEAKGFGYTIDFAESNHRQFGMQKMPKRIYFETLGDFIRYIGKKKEYDTYVRLAELTIARLPQLAVWVKSNPLRLIEHEASWDRILSVCTYFMAHPIPSLYIRQLDIPGVDTKFIEGNKSIVKTLLDDLLPDSAVRKEVTGITSGGFEQRYGLLYDEPLVRFRVLDPSLAYHGQTDLSMPASQFNSLSLPCSRVFFTENKVNMLCFPPVKKAIVVFGGGYAVGTLKQVEWLKEREIIYWGDIDTHGFSILSQLRGYFPHVHSTLMDYGTFIAFKEQWGTEEEGKQCTHELPYLTADEWQLYSDLRDNVYGVRIRLEQERIPFHIICTNLLKYNTNANF